LNVVKKGFINGKQVTQVFRDGNLSKVQVVDSDRLEEAKKLYSEVIEKITQLKEARIALAKMDAADPNYAAQEATVKQFENELYLKK